MDVENREAEVWASLEGSFAEVSSRLVISPPYLEQPPSENAAPDREVWGVQFKVAVELCPPEGGGECEARTGLRAIIVDHETGEWIRTSTYAPSPGEPLPPPQN